MACMEHNCMACHAVWFNNQASHDACPVCGSSHISSYFDEEPDYDPPEMEDYDEDC